MSFKKSVPENYLNKLQDSMRRRVQLCSRIEVVIPNKAFKLGTNSVFLYILYFNVCLRIF